MSLAKRHSRHLSRDHAASQAWVRGRGRCQLGEARVLLRWNRSRKAFASLRERFVQGRGVPASVDVLALSSPLAVNGSPGRGVRLTFRPSIRTWGEIGSPAAFASRSEARSPTSSRATHSRRRCCCCTRGSNRRLVSTACYRRCRRRFAYSRWISAAMPANGYALVNFANDIEAFMDAAGLQSAVLLGSSSGGYVAQQVAVQVPHRVDGLVLVGAPRSLQGRPAFADEVDRLTDPVDPTWVEESLTWFPPITTCPTGTSRTGYATVCACPHTSGRLVLRDSRPPSRHPSPGRSPRPHPDHVG
jgi:hypothetical protein